MDKGVIEGREDPCDAENELACEVLGRAPMLTGESLTFSDLGTKRNVLLGWTGGFLWWHLD